MLSKWSSRVLTIGIGVVALILIADAGPWRSLVSDSGMAVKEMSPGVTLQGDAEPADSAAAEADPLLPTAIQRRAEQIRTDRLGPSQEWLRSVQPSGTPDTNQAQIPMFLRLVIVAGCLCVAAGSGWIIYARSQAVVTSRGRSADRSPGRADSRPIEVSAPRAADPEPAQHRSTTSPRVTEPVVFESLVFEATLPESVEAEPPAAAEPTVVAEPPVVPGSPTAVESPVVGETPMVAQSSVTATPEPAAMTTNSEDVESDAVSVEVEPMESELTPTGKAPEEIVPVMANRTPLVSNAPRAMVEGLESLEGVVRSLEKTVHGFDTRLTDFLHQRTEEEMPRLRLTSPKRIELVLDDELPGAVTLPPTPDAEPAAESAASAESAQVVGLPETAVEPDPLPTGSGAALSLIRSRRGSHNSEAPDNEIAEDDAVGKEPTRNDVASVDQLGATREQVLDLAGKGLPPAEISRLVGLSPTEVALILRTLFDGARTPSESPAIRAAE